MLNRELGPWSLPRLRGFTLPLVTVLVCFYVAHERSLGTWLATMAVLFSAAAVSWRLTPATRGHAEPSELAQGAS